MSRVSKLTLPLHDFIQILHLPLGLLQKMTHIHSKHTIPAFLGLSFWPVVYSKSTTPKTQFYVSRYFLKSIISLGTSIIFGIIPFLFFQCRELMLKIPME